MLTTSGCKYWYSDFAALYP